MLIKKFFTIGMVVLSTKALGMLVGILLASTLGSAEYGKYALVMSTISITLIFTAIGLPQFLVREVAYLTSTKRHSELKGVIIWSVLISVTLSALALVVIFIISNEALLPINIKNYYFFFIILIPFYTLISVIYGIINGLNLPIYSQLAELAKNLLITIFILTAWLLNIDMTVSKVLLLHSILTVIIACGITLLLVNKIKNLISDISATFFISIWKKKLSAFSIFVLISVVNFELGVFLTGIISGDAEEVAYLKVATQLGAIILIGLNVVDIIISPELARKYSSQGVSDEFQKIVTRSVRLSSIVGVPIILIFLFYGDFFIYKLFGSEYTSSLPVLKILCIGELFNVTLGSGGVILNMTSNEKLTISSLFISLISSSITMFLMIPTHGAIGAACGISLGVIIWNILMSFGCYKWLKVKTWLH